MALMPTDLPEPVVPATNTCGILAKSATIGLPPMSLPKPMVSMDLASLYTDEPKISLKRMDWRLALGNSSAMKFLPGMVSTTRMDTMLSERAKSLAKFTICEPFTPVAGSIS